MLGRTRDWGKRQQCPPSPSARDPSRARGYSIRGLCVAENAGVALGRQAEERVDGLGMGGVDELDAAMNHLDRLLKPRSGGPFRDVTPLPDQRQPMRDRRQLAADSDAIGAKPS